MSDKIDSSPLSPAEPIRTLLPAVATPAATPAIDTESASAFNGTGAPFPSVSIASYTSIGSKKRAHAESEHRQDTMTSAKRVKKETASADAKPVPKAVRKPAQKAAPRVGTRSSGRARKAPERFETLASPPKPATTTARKFGSRVFEPVYITTNANSRLKKTDLFHMLLKAHAWTCLTSEQKLDILNLLPLNSINLKLANNLGAGTAAEDARPREVSLNFNLFRTDVAKFKEDLANGHLGKTWQTSAEQAIKDRAAGAFDEWKEREAELWWGQN
ncbi:hypothetical protein PMIN06_002678 [Paraphaeosphaeria minitans]|uniref:ASX DEUBAD domain-containing protein n=1 Tax=Paraphaeosphaeria minitans TaxID=565426 RepID=A0A9P6GAZ3_9PLEO|nr:hypothetical protein PMIN01_10003 [Paraphaeosphaeria minitans]